MVDKLKNQTAYLLPFVLLSLILTDFKTTIISFGVILLILQTSSLTNFAGIIKADLHFFMRTAVNFAVGLGCFHFIWVLFSIFFKGKIRVYFLLLCLILVYLSLAFIKKTKKSHESLFRKRNILTLIIFLIILSAAVCFPFKNIGKNTNQGFAYRAYFSTDYLKHFGVTSKLAYSKIPPENPYFKNEKLHYYWIPYSFPSTIYVFNKNIKNSVLIWSLIVNYIFLTIFFYFIFSFFKRNKKPYLKSVLISLTPIFFLSFEGIYFLINNAKGNFLNYINLGKDYNIDALTRWIWNLPQIDALLRSLLYTPQHLLSLTFLLIYLYFRRIKRNHVYFFGILFIFSFSTSLFIGIVFLIIYFIDQIHLFFSNRKDFSLTNNSLFLFFVILSGFFLLAVRIIKLGAERHFIVKTIPLEMLIPFLFLNLGFVFILGLIGSVVFSLRSSNFFSIIGIISIISVFRIEGFESDISLKFGLVLILLLTESMLTLLTKVKFKKVSLFCVLFFFFFLGGIFTSGLDVYNSSDITNRKFTLYVNKDEYKLLNWSKKHLPKGKIIQEYPLIREEYFSIIPTFSDCSAFVGDKMHGQIFLIDPNKYRNRVELMEKYFKNISYFKKELSDLGIEYVFWGPSEKERLGYIPECDIFKKYGEAYIFKLDGMNNTGAAFY